MRSRSSLLGARLAVPTWPDATTPGATARAPTALAKKCLRPSDASRALTGDMPSPFPIWPAGYIRSRAFPRPSPGAWLPASSAELEHVTDVVEIPEVDGADPHPQAPEVRPEPGEELERRVVDVDAELDAGLRDEQVSRAGAPIRFVDHVALPAGGEIAVHPARGRGRVVQEPAEIAQPGV